jgi:glycosyltransferase involved in cell wall biosynthesis
MQDSAAMAAAIHVVPPNGGGVDRYVRGICRIRRQDWILHVSASQWVAEHPAAGVLIPVVPGAEAIHALGHNWIVHAHSTLPDIREAVQQIGDGAADRYVLTLHDIAFTDADAFTSPEEQAARTEFVRRAAHLIAPSNYIAEGARKLLGSESTPLSVIPNGVNSKVAATQSPEGPRPDQPEHFDIAVIGALGVHKGLHLLDEVTSCLPSNLRVVVIGYVDGQTAPGWRVPGRIWVHGAFEPTEIRDFVERTGVRLAFFPNRVPESFCYALSDAWLAGLPALVPDRGALGERMAVHQAGWIYPHDETPALLASRIEAVLAKAAGMADLVEAAAQQQVSEEQMVNALDKIYASHTSPPTAGEPLAAIARLAQTHLNGAFFRQELVKLTHERAHLLAQQARLQAELSQLSQAQAQRVAWIERQQADIATLKAETSRVEAARAAENQEFLRVIQDLRRDIENLDKGNALLAQQLHHLQHEHTESEALLSALLLPLRILPVSLRERLIRSAKWRLARRNKK